jgi:hypothetical protein
MAELFFSFRAGVSVAKQGALIQEFRLWPGVQAVTRFAPDAPGSDMVRVCVVYLTPAADASALVGWLLAVPEVEQAEAPAQRTSL